MQCVYRTPIVCQRLWVRGTYRSADGFSVCELALLRSSICITAAGLVLYAMLIYPIFADFIRYLFFLSFFNLNTIITVIGLIRHLYE